MANMFVRIKSTPNSPRKSVQIVKSVRTGEKVRQTIVRHVGIAADDEELQQLRDLAELIRAKLQHAVEPSFFPPEEIARQVIEARRNRDTGTEPMPVDLRNLHEEQRMVLGVHEVYGALLFFGLVWRGFPELFRSVWDNSSHIALI